MSDQFKALVLNQQGEDFTREVKSINKSFLKHGDVTVKVDYSDLNFKDGMILKNGGRLVKEFPHIPGIDFSGTVLESENSKFKTGDEIILTGFRVGEIFYGGYSQIAKVNGNFLVKKPKNITSKQAMILGTAGFTSLMAAFAIKALIANAAIKEVKPAVPSIIACLLVMFFGFLTKKLPLTFAI